MCDGVIDNLSDGQVQRSTPPHRRADPDLSFPGKPRVFVFLINRKIEDGHPAFFACAFQRHAAAVAAYQFSGDGKTVADAAGRAAVPATRTTTLRVVTVFLII